MVDQWAIFISLALMTAAFGIIVFYIIPLQTRLVLGIKDWLTGLRWRLLLTSLFIAIAASPVVTNRILRYFGINSIILNNISIIATGCAFLAFSLALVSVYQYKKKE